MVLNLFTKLEPNGLVSQKFASEEGQNFYILDCSFGNDLFSSFFFLRSYRILLRISDIEKILKYSLRLSLNDNRFGDH